MKIRLIHFLCVFCLISFFWACTEEDIYTVTTEDLIAAENIKKLDADDYDAMMDSCLADTKCAALWDSTLGRPVWKRKSSSSSAVEDSVLSSDDEEVSSSSAPKSSSSEKEASSDSKESSSSKKAESSSSAKASESSSSKESSSSSAKSSSSKEAESSSSVKSSSSEKVVESSSSEEPESSSSYLPPSGKCKVDKIEADLGEPVTWSYVPDEGTLSSGSYRWYVDADAEPYFASNKGKGTGEVLPFVVKYTEAGDKTTTYLKLADVKIECDRVLTNVQVSDNEYDGPALVESSSSDAPILDPESSSSEEIVPEPESSSSEEIVPEPESSSAVEEVTRDTLKLVEFESNGCSVNDCRIKGDVVLLESIVSSGTVKTQGVSCIIETNIIGFRDFYDKLAGGYTDYEPDGKSDLKNYPDHPDIVVLGSKGTFNLPQAFDVGEGFFINFHTCN